jgi:hypothetical protein
VATAGSSSRAAFRAERAYVNGTLIRDKRAIFLGVEAFEMVGGGGQNVATFELTDAPAPAKTVSPQYRYSGRVRTPRL